MSSKIDPRDFDLTADELRTISDMLYDADDPRYPSRKTISHDFNRTRSRLRALADAMEDQEYEPGDYSIPKWKD